MERDISKPKIKPESRGLPTADKEFGDVPKTSNTYNDILSYGCI
jgi:hypothetical protein